MSNDYDIQQRQPENAANSALLCFDVTERTSRDLIRREIIKLFRYTELSPREILQRLMEQFYSSPVTEEERRTFLRHATIWVREEALIRGAMATVRPNMRSRLLDAFRYLERADLEGARILELTYVAEITSVEIANILSRAPEIVARKLQWIHRG